MVDIDIINKGGLVRTFSVVDPSLKRKRLIVNVALLDIILLNGVLLYVWLNLTPSLTTTIIAMMVFVTIAAMVQHLLLKSVLLRGAFPVTLYSNGFEFPTFVFNRVLGRPEFIRREDVASIWVSGFEQGARAVEMKDMRTLGFRTRSGKTNDTGARSAAEVEAAVLWIEKNWGSKVERYSTPFAAQTAPRTAHKERVVTRACPTCGRAVDMALSFCPYCGKMLNQSVPPFPSEPQQAPTIGDLQRTSQAEQTVRPLENPYRSPTPSNYIPNPSMKDPKKAFILALVMGFLGIMGMGHVYMDKKVKGFLLLFIGGFLAIMSLFTWLTVWDNDYSMAVNLITAIVLSVPYLVLQIWQAFDAPKPKKEWSRGQ